MLKQHFVLSLLALVAFLAPLPMSSSDLGTGLQASDRTPLGLDALHLPFPSFGILSLRSRPPSVATAAFLRDRMYHDMLHCMHGIIFFFVSGVKQFRVSLSRA
jgi:hypothetical protein